MRTLIAYVLVIPFSIVVMMVGSVLGGFPIALALAWTSVGLRTKIAGFIGGIAGVFAAVFFGYCLFAWITGESYTLGPFLASILPLALPIANDFAQAARVKKARATLFTSLDEKKVAAIGDLTKTPDMCSGIGSLFGDALAIAWFFTQH